MADYDVLLEGYRSGYRSRLKHLDDLLAEAERAKGAGRETAVRDDELAALRREREQLLKDAERLQKKDEEAWQGETLENAGPMIMWQEVAKRLEGLIDRIGRVKQ